MDIGPVDKQQQRRQKMFRTVEINHSPPPRPAPKPKKELKPIMPKKKLLKTIQWLEKRVCVLEKVQKKYDKISKKYNTDLATWVKEQDDLPDYDHGKNICRLIEKFKDYPGKLKFYKRLLEAYKDQPESEGGVPEEGQAV